MSRHWPAICLGRLVCWSQPRWKSWMKRTPRSASRRASRQFAANVPGLRASGPYRSKTSVAARFERSVSSGTDVCMRKAISYWAMRVAISGSPISSMLQLVEPREVVEHAAGASRRSTPAGLDEVQDRVAAASGT